MKSAGERSEMDSGAPPGRPTFRLLSSGTRSSSRKRAPRVTGYASLRRHGNSTATPAGREGRRYPRAGSEPLSVDRGGRRAGTRGDSGHREGSTEYAEAFIEGFGDIAPDGVLDVGRVVCSAPSWRIPNSPRTTLQRGHRDALRAAIQEKEREPPSGRVHLRGQARWRCASGVKSGGLA